MHYLGISLTLHAWSTSPAYIHTYIHVYTPTTCPTQGTYSTAAALAPALLRFCTFTGATVLGAVPSRGSSLKWLKLNSEWWISNE